MCPLEDSGAEVGRSFLFEGTVFVFGEVAGRSQSLVTY